MPERITSYRDLTVWQRSIELAELVYNLTETFPAPERFGLSFQMRKAAVSIASNIAEGTRHRTPGYLSRVIIALGEHAELETQAVLARRRSYMSAVNMVAFEHMSESVGQLAHALAGALEARIAHAPRGRQRNPIT